jgi:hypothetical protein
VTFYAHFFVSAHHCGQNRGAPPAFAQFSMQRERPSGQVFDFSPVWANAEVGATPDTDTIIMIDRKIAANARMYPSPSAIEMLPLCGGPVDGRTGGREETAQATRPLGDR